MYIESDLNEKQINPFAPALEPVWERVRTAASIVAALREEKIHLEERVAGLEDEVRRTKSQLDVQGAELVRLRLLVDTLEISVQSSAPVQTSTSVQSLESVPSPLSVQSTAPLQPPVSAQKSPPVFLEISPDERAVLRQKIKTALLKIDVHLMAS